MNRSYSKIRHIQESNDRLEKRMLSEQQTTNKGGFACSKGNTHTVCSKKDNYGFTVRVFDNKSFDSNPNELPNVALFQAGGKTWQETIGAFENNKKTKAPGLNIITPTEPSSEQPYDRQQPLRNF
jgi:hypothetical protein